MAENSGKKNRKVDGKKLAVRILCIFLAFSMVAGTVLAVIFYLLGN
ncbi:MAG: hypothetical protein IKI41_05195 [Clostridia bacterium]|jgi:hypothetical protein|nr:hypothetical protein [Clostridia bacterium]MBR7078124.1 hypothetical protein [Clostridia bacterium]